MKRILFLGLALVTGGATITAAGERVLVIDPAQSRIEVDVKATMGSFVGSLADYDARIRVDGSPAAVKSATFGFKFVDVKTGEAKRDRHMHDWQQTETFPDCRFELSKLTAQPDGSQLAVGKLTLHGQTHTLTFPAQIATEGATLVIDGEAAIDTQEYGLPIIRKFVALKVNPLVTVRFHLQGKVPAAE